MTTMPSETRRVIRCHSSTMCWCRRPFTN